jgi:hypothetical protein
MRLRSLLCVSLIALLTACGGGGGSGQSKIATAQPAACKIAPDDLWLTAHEEPAADVPRSMAAFVGVWKGTKERMEYLELSITNVKRDPQAGGSLPYSTSGWANSYVGSASMSRSGGGRFVDERTLQFGERDGSSSNLDFAMRFVIADDFQTLNGTVENRDGTTTFTLNRCAAGK